MGDGTILVGNLVVTGARTMLYAGKVTIEVVVHNTGKVGEGEVAVDVITRELPGIVGVIPDPQSLVDPGGGANCPPAWQHQCCWFGVTLAEEVKGTGHAHVAATDEAKNKSGAFV